MGSRGRGRPRGGRLGDDVRARVLEELRYGAGIRAAGRAAGVAHSTVRYWVAQAGGMPPRELRPLPAGVYATGSRRLEFVDRCRIESLVGQGYRPAQIAGFLGRARSTITRELRRGRDESGRYRAKVAQRAIEASALRPRAARLETNPPLRAAVVEGLAQRHSPAQVAGRLRRDHPDDPEMWVSHETIYQALYVQPRGQLAREVRAAIAQGEALRTGRVKRRRQGRAPRGGIPNMVSISARPAEVADRAIPGHWEGDLIMGAGNASAIGTLVERTSGFVLLLHLPGDHTAATVAAAMIAAIPTLPEQLRRSLTWDQGKEMARHAEITAATGLPIYFADPHSPWQRGSNENTNGLLRQYFPKGSDLSVWGPGYLDLVAAELNARPRKRHDWATPAEILDELLSPQGRVA